MRSRSEADFALSSIVESKTLLLLLTAKASGIAGHECCGEMEYSNRYLEDGAHRRKAGTSTETTIKGRRLATILSCRPMAETDVMCVCVSLSLSGLTLSYLARW